MEFSIASDTFKVASIKNSSIAIINYFTVKEVAVLLPSNCAPFYQLGIAFWACAH